MSLPCTCSSWPTASQPLEITFLLKRGPSGSPAPPFASRPLLFFRLFNADQVLSARSRFYCARTRDPKEGKMDEGLPRNVVRNAGEIKASKGFSFRSQSLFFRVRSEL